MLVKAVKSEHYQDYKYPCMFIACRSCTFKCDKECGKQVCQNSTLANAPDIKVDILDLIKRYIENPITKAICWGGLEPFDNITDVMVFIHTLRTKYHNSDTVILYTGYTKEEIKDKFYIEYSLLKEYGNIIIKYGRFIPNQQPHYDEVLGVQLASDNQYAERLDDVQDE